MLDGGRTLRGAASHVVTHEPGGTDDPDQREKQDDRAAEHQDTVHCPAADGRFCSVDYRCTHGSPSFATSDKCVGIICGTPGGYSKENRLTF